MGKRYAARRNYKGQRARSELVDSNKKAICVCVCVFLYMQSTKNNFKVMETIYVYIGIE